MSDDQTTGRVWVFQTNANRYPHNGPLISEKLDANPLPFLRENFDVGPRRDISMFTQTRSPRRFQLDVEGHESAASILLFFRLPLDFPAGF